MHNISFSKDEKRQIIVENFSNPAWEVSLDKLKSMSAELNAPFCTFHSLNINCGDTINLLIKKQDKHVKLAFFASEQQACCLTVAAANILCEWIKGKSFAVIQQEISNIEYMLQGKTYKKDYRLFVPQMLAFQELSKFNQRLECVNLVLRGIKNLTR